MRDCSYADTCFTALPESSLPPSEAEQPEPSPADPAQALCFVGHVDAIEDGELYGWAMNVSAPAEPVAITIMLNGQPVADALAGYYRPDVSQALHCSGRNGFYVFLDALVRHSGPAEVRVLFPDGSDIDGSPFIYCFPETKPEIRAKTLLFMHIPKTAGTSLREAVLRNYRQSEVIYIYGDPPGFPSTFIGDVPPQQRHRARLVFGHYGYGVHDFILNNCEYAAVVRHPLQRIWSHYLHLARDNNSTLTYNGCVRPIEEVLEERISLQLDNLYVRYFCGLDESELAPGTINRDIYDLARKNASRENVFLQTHKNVAETYDSFATKFDWIRGLRCSHLNVSPCSVPPTHVQQQAIRHFNSWDFQLFDEVLCRCDRYLPPGA